MSDVKLPPDIEAAAEAAIAHNSDHIQCHVMAGVRWLFAHLTAQTPEFDEAAVRKEFMVTHDPNSRRKSVVFDGRAVKGARWQFERMAAQVAALRANSDDRDHLREALRLACKAGKQSEAEIERLRAKCDDLAKENVRVIAIGVDLQIERDRYRDSWEALHADMDRRGPFKLASRYRKALERIAAWNTDHAIRGIAREALRTPDQPDSREP